MSRTLRAGLVAMAAAAAGACASTSFNSTWKSPDAKPVNMQGQKVVAFVMTPDESVRYGAEDALAREITARGAIGVAGYSVVPKELTKDKEKAKEFLEKAGVKGAIVLRVVGKDKEISSTPGSMAWGAPYYGSFWAGGGYYAWGWGGVYSPGYLQTDTIVSVETLAYDLGQDKLIWAGMSETTNPKEVGPFVKELANKVAAEMKKQGVIGAKQ